MVFIEGKSSNLEAYNEITENISKEAEKVSETNGYLYTLFNIDSDLDTVTRGYSNFLTKKDKTKIIDTYFKVCDKGIEYWLTASTNTHPGFIKKAKILAEHELQFAQKQGLNENIIENYKKQIEKIEDRKKFLEAKEADVLKMKDYSKKISDMKEMKPSLKKNIARYNEFKWSAQSTFGKAVDTLAVLGLPLNIGTYLNGYGPGGLIINVVCAAAVAGKNIYRVYQGKKAADKVADETSQLLKMLD